MRILIVGNGSSGVDSGQSIYINNHTGNFLLSLKNKLNKVAYCSFITQYDKDSNLLNFNLKESGISFIPIKQGTKLFLTKEIIKIFVAKLWSYDFIYIFFPGSLGKVVGLLSILTGKSFGFYVRGELFGNNWIDRLILIKASFILTVSPSIKNRLLNLNKKVDVIKPMVSIEPDDLLINRKIYIKQKTRLLFVGRVEERKGIKELIEAFRILKKEIANIELLIVGGGDLLDVLKMQVLEDSVLAKSIAFTGLISDRKKLIDLYRASDLFVFPSHDEGFPRVLYDAMAQSLPILTTMVGGIPGYMQDGNNCIELPLKNPIGIATKIKSIILDINLQKRIVDNSVKTLKDILNKEKHEVLLVRNINNTI